MHYTMMLSMPPDRSAATNVAAGHIATETRCPRYVHFSLNLRHEIEAPRSTTGHNRNL